MRAAIRRVMPIASIDPRTGEVCEMFDALTDAAIDHKLELAGIAFQHWRRTTFSERAVWPGHTRGWSYRSLSWSA